MKENHSSQNAQESGTSSFTRLRSKLSFERMVEMGAKMGMENPLFLCHERAAKATTVINGKEYINFSTYDYLDLNTHPEITEAVTEAARVFGSSAGASRLVGGERPPHRQLERALADFYGVEDCIAYVSGHATNVSTLGFLFGHRDAIFYDGLAHNSLMQGARLSGADRYSYEHNDCDALEKMLKEHRGKHKRACIVTEGLFSMDGNIPDLPRIIELKKKYDCMLLVDEAHSFGVLGAILAFLCRYEEGRPPVVREPQEVNPLHGLRKFLYPAAARPAVIEFFVMLGVSCCNIFIFTYAVLQGYANPSFFMVVAALSMTVSNLASGRLLRALGHRTLLSIAMVLSGALIALIALVPSQETFYLGGVGFGMAQGFSFPILTLLAVDNVPQNHRGTANSTMLMAGDLGVGLGTLLWGISIQFCGFHVSIALSGLAVILSGVLSLLFYCRCKP